MPNTTRSGLHFPRLTVKEIQEQCAIIDALPPDDWDEDDLAWLDLRDTMMQVQTLNATHRRMHHLMASMLEALEMKRG